VKKLSVKVRLFLVLVLAPGLAAAQEGQWLVAPYLWTADVSWDLEARGSGGVAFSDLVDKLDGAALIRIEYVRNKIGFTIDYVNMSLSDRTNISTPGPIPIDINIKAGVDLTVFEAGVFYRPSATDSGVTQTGFPTERFDTGKGFTDIYLGARYLHRFTESWDFSVRGDYGFGGSDGALNLMAGVGWRSRGAFGMSLAYRHLAFELDQKVEGEAVTNEFDFSGPALGFLFRF